MNKTAALVKYNVLYVTVCRHREHSSIAQGHRPLSPKAHLPVYDSAPCFL